MTKLQNEMIQKLQENLNCEIASYIIEEYNNIDDLKSYVSDVVSHGSSSEIVNGLIYTINCINWHDTFENEINKIIIEYLDEKGLSFSEVASDIELWDIQQLKTFKSWFAYEMVSSNILSAIEDMEEEQNSSQRV